MTLKNFGFVCDQNHWSRIPDFAFRASWLTQPSHVYSSTCTLRSQVRVKVGTPSSVIGPCSTEICISLIKLGCRERSPGATVRPRDFVDDSIWRARDGNSWKLIGIGKFAIRCHGNLKNLHFCMKNHLSSYCGYLLRRFLTDLNEICHDRSVRVRECSGGTRFQNFQICCHGNSNCGLWSSIWPGRSEIMP